MAVAPGSIIRFMENLTLGEGQFSGQKMRVYDFQREWVHLIFGRNRATKRRLRREVVLGIARKNAKLIEISTPVPTPRGWTTQGALREGDLVFSETGTPTRVTLLSERKTAPMLRVEFSDGTHVRCSEDHLWTFVDKRGKRRTRTAEWFMRNFTEGARGDRRWSTVPAHPLALPAADLPLDPYALGVWLGDGSLGSGRVSGLAADLAHYAACGVEYVSEPHKDPRSRSHTATIRGAHAVVASMADKRIPPEYLRASVAQRLALLRGIMDTDGHVTPRGQCLLSQCSARLPLLLDVVELLRSLGVKVSAPQPRTTACQTGAFDSYQISFHADTPAGPCVTLPRKLARVRPSTGRAWTRRVTEIRPDGEGECVCIRVAHPSHLYLVGEGMVATHNTATSAAMALGALVLETPEDPGNLIVLAAKTRSQAGLLLTAAKRFVRGSSIRGIPLTKFLQVRQDHIYFAQTDSYLKVIAAEAQGQHGLNPGIFFIDEGHAALEKDDELFETLTSAQGARKDPLGVIITTAGPRPSGPMYGKYRYGQRVNSGEINDPRFGMIWKETPPEFEIDNPEGWAIASPALGKFVFQDFYADQVKSILQGNGSEFMFRRLYLNQWTTAMERWLPWDRVLACQGEVEIPEGSDVYLGIDASLSRDTFAVAVVGIGEGLSMGEDMELSLSRTIAHVKGKVFRSPHPDDPKEKYIDPEQAMLYILGLSSYYNIVDVAYDPAYFGLLRGALEDRGVPMNPMAQTATNMEEATETFQRMFLDVRVRHGGDKEFMDQLANIAVKPTERGVRISKAKSGGPVDYAIAAAMAMQRAFGDEDTGTYTAHGAWIAETGDSHG